MQRTPDTTTRRYCDLAYACYAFAGLVPILIAVLSHVPMDTGTAGGIGLLVLVPLMLGAIVAVVIGLRYTVRVWRHWPLIVCGAFSLLYLLIFLTEYGPGGLRAALPIVYGLTMLGFSLRWFLYVRRTFATA